MSTLIKFCGLRLEEDIKYVRSLKASYAGFIMSEGFWRYVSPSRVSTLRVGLDPSTKVVGVFVDEDVSYVASCINDNVIDIAQLHGHEDETYIRNLREKTFGKAVIIKVFTVLGLEDIVSAKKSSADYVLLDSGVGGTGKSFDWSLVKELKREFFLAGGLNPENVGEAIRKCHPMVVDVSSGVEVNRQKNYIKMSNFARAVKEASCELNGGKDG